LVQKFGAKSDSELPGRRPSRQGKAVHCRLDLTGYILRTVLPLAQADIAEAERLTAPERDSLRVLALLEDPPSAPNRLVRARLIDAALVRVALSSGRSRNSTRPLSLRALDLETPWFQSPAHGMIRPSPFALDCRRGR